ncbi:hypothetical protein EV715DRAFT_298189 [Schizophyllum commune]
MTSPASAVKATTNVTSTSFAKAPVAYLWYQSPYQQGQPDETYRGSSGYCKIPGDICEGGIAKDAPVEKQCSQAEPAEGDVVHQTLEFPAVVAQHADFKDSPTILVPRLLPSQVPRQPRVPRQLSTRFYYTTDAKRNWYEAPNPPNTFRAPVLRFNRTSDYLIWVSNKDCEAYSRDNGRRWTTIDECVQHCAWARDARLAVDHNEIWCESFRDKKGSQRMFGEENPLELVVGGNYYMKKCRMFEHVASFVKFSEYLVVAAMGPKSRSLQLQVSLVGANFAKGRFPPSLHPEMLVSLHCLSNPGNYLVFLHMTVSEPSSLNWDIILKSNSTGMYSGDSAEHVNRDKRGSVDFEKMIGLDVIALIKIVGNADEAIWTGRKALQSRIAHNDGGTWKLLNTPPVDFFGNEYEVFHGKRSVQSMQPASSIC